MALAAMAWALGTNLGYVFFFFLDFHWPCLETIFLQKCGY